PGTQEPPFACCALAPLPVESLRKFDCGLQSSNVHLPDGKPLGPGKPPSSPKPPSPKPPSPKPPSPKPPSPKPPSVWKGPLSKAVPASGTGESAFCEAPSMYSSFVTAAKRGSLSMGELHPGAAHTTRGNPAQRTAPENAKRLFM